jgi:hypothetical protein
LALGKKIIIVKNTIAYTWDWYCHLVVDRASFKEPRLRNELKSVGYSVLAVKHPA